MLIYFFAEHSKMKEFDCSLRNNIEDGHQYTLTSIAEALIRSHETQSNVAAFWKLEEGHFSCPIKKRIIMEISTKSPGKQRQQALPQDCRATAVCHQPIVQKYNPANFNT